MHSLVHYRSLNERTHAYTLKMLTDEYRYKILKMVEANPALSQRALARDLGISLGKANFCVKGLIEVGLIKVSNFRNSQNKLSYMYLLTPSGVEAKASITLRFLQMKMQEFDALKAEIEALQTQVGDARRTFVIHESGH